MNPKSAIDSATDTRSDTRHPTPDTRMCRAWVEVDLSAIRTNMAVLQGLVGAGAAIMAVVKADAYGHGLVAVARAALEAGARWLGVAAVEEGASLRAAGIAAPILLLCAPAPGEASALVAHRLIPLVGDTATLCAVAEAAGGEGVEVHLEIDTGMGRSGALPEQAMTLWRQATQRGLCVTGLATHFADADGPDETLTRAQEADFHKARVAMEAAGARFDWIHLCNSAATLAARGIGSNLVRPGLLMYGILPPNGIAASLRCPVRPALSVSARVATVRALPKGHPISYGATRRLARDSRVATILIGYGDGYPRRLSNCGCVLLQGRRAPILGRVCMDQTVVDVTDLPAVKPGDIAVCLGAQGAERISVEELAALIDATEHEITTCLTSRLPRCYPASE